jgi:cyclase
MNNSNTNIKRRVIPLILVSNYQVVKSREFKDHRTFGNLEQTITVFNHRNIDEIIVVDIDASKNATKINLELLNILSKNCLMPFSYGGGIRSNEDIRRCLLSGCEKVVINSKCIEDIEFIQKAGKVFGSQCIVASVDYKIIGKNGWQIFSHAGFDTTKLEPKQYIKDLVNLGAGELLLTSVNHEGHMKGYDTSFYEYVCDEINVPILLNGGCGKPEDINKLYSLGIDGFCAGSIFYYTKYGYKDIKDYLVKNNFNVRPG